jgi:C-terminal processing protease CtpA/Prc
VNETAYRAMMREANCMMERPAILPGNVGYLKLDWFPEPEACGGAVAAAMKMLGRADGLIIDLRENSGGSPEMVMFVAGWLFDRPAFFWNPRESDAGRMWTQSPMAGSALAGKQVWVLTSSRTYSAAEQFAYNLKMLQRATIVGETTAGATDVGVFHRIDDHFGIGLEESRVRNPYAAADWAVNGVQPDVRVAAGAALETARRLAGSELARR